MKTLLRLIGKRLAHFLSKPRDEDAFLATSQPELLMATLQEGDVLLVEGTSRFSSAVKYLTQSSWSHAALYIGYGQLVEADVEFGIRKIPVSSYSHLHTRICRPVGLTDEEIERVIEFATQRIGHQYDLKNIFDLARYLIRTPPVPSRWRRRMITLGSGDPTRAICSSLIAQAFQSIRYPILPDRYVVNSGKPGCENCYEEVLSIRHHSLFMPRDFDISPYFSIIKPGIAHGFDRTELSWDDDLQLLPRPTTESA